MHDQSELVFSKLSRSITERGVTIQVVIYRDEAAAEWCLRIVNQDGGHTVWEDPFPSEEKALAEAMQTIERDGIKSFLRSPSTTVH